MTTTDRPMGYDTQAVEAWIARNVPGLRPPLAWHKLEGGHSNLTYRITDADGRQAVQLASGKFAMLDDGVGFSLVPWRPVIDKRLGQSISATIRGSGVSWEIGRSRGLSI